MEIQAAVVGDASAILALQRLAYQSEAQLYADYSIPPLRQTLAELEAEFVTHVFLKALMQGEIVGSVRAHLENDVCYVGRLIVHPRVQGQGIGSALMGQIETYFPEARCFELFTGTRSADNIRLYRRLGYEPVFTRTLSDRVTLVFMRKPR
jgi:ribosomal protein S18 acetylase RimI-like enzyme